jgi:hypothetical protein
MSPLVYGLEVNFFITKTTLRNKLTNTILQGLMMVSIHGPDDSEFDFRTAMNIWGKLRKRHILVEKAKESTEKSKFFKKNCYVISFAKENYK